MPYPDDEEDLRDYGNCDLCKAFHDDPCTCTVCDKVTCSDCFDFDTGTCENCEPEDEPEDEDENEDENETPNPEPEESK